MEERLLAIIDLALKNNASDIHFAYNNGIVRIQMRVNGSIREVKTKVGDEKLIRYLQYLANLDIGNLLIPQTGQFELNVNNKLISLRYAVISTISSVNATLRILNNHLDLDIDHLSLLNKQNAYFKELLKADNGLVLFSGPTGSGKTTTLYSLLKTVSKDKKIFTIEDPVEVFYDDFVQLQVNEKTGLDYEEGIKQLLRHDPDIIMIGEIRDSKAAKWALVAANTGHLVFSTIHANNAASCIARMNELGVNENHLYDELLCLVNQRMVIDRSHEKQVIYEIMDHEEIKYYQNNHSYSDTFLSLDKQLKDGIQNGIF